MPAKILQQNKDAIVSLKNPSWTVWCEQRGWLKTLHDIQNKDLRHFSFHQEIPSGPNSPRPYHD